MWLNNKEEKKIGNLLSVMEKADPNSQYEFKWNSGTKIVCCPFSTYESDNGLEVEDPDFEEFWVIAVKIVSIIKEGPELGEITSDNIIEINYHNAPQEYKKM